MRAWFKGKRDALALWLGEIVQLDEGIPKPDSPRAYRLLWAGITFLLMPLLWPLVKGLLGVLYVLLGGILLVFPYIAYKGIRSKTTKEFRVTVPKEEAGKFEVIMRAHGAEVRT